MYLFKGTQAWNNFEFFLPKSISYMLSASISKFDHFRGDLSYAEPNFFGLISKKIYYSMCMLSIRGNDFIAHWADEERIFAHAQPAVKCEQFLHVNLCWAYAERISSLAEHTRNGFHRWLSIRGGIEYDFQKSRVTGPWDHKVSVSAKKFNKKISCLCTFKSS